MVTVATVFITGPSAAGLSFQLRLDTGRICHSECGRLFSAVMTVTCWMCVWHRVCSSCWMGISTHPAYIIIGGWVAGWLAGPETPVGSVLWWAGRWWRSGWRVAWLGVSWNLDRTAWLQPSMTGFYVTMTGTVTPTHCLLPPASWFASMQWKCRQWGCSITVLYTTASCQVLLART